LNGTDEDRRRAAALAAVAAAERAATGRRVLRPRRFHLADDLAWRAGADLTGVPAEVRPAGALPADARPVRARSRAALVRFGKFDRDGSIRARAYLLERRPTALKVQTDRRDGRHGVDREVRARRQVAALVPDLAPALYGTGYLPAHEVSWLAEEIVHGVHPAGPQDVTEHADAVIGAVTRLYLASGIASEPARDVLEPSTAERFEETARHHPGLSRFLPAVHELIARDGDLEVAFGHGDLVGSNVLVREDGSVVLVDWEYARRRPVADDLASVLTQARRKGPAIEVIERHLGAHVGVGSRSYTLREQLVLAQVRMLSWYPRRRERAERAGRLAALRRDTDRRAKALRVLLR
jgi:hypothetical protein